MAIDSTINGYTVDRDYSTVVNLGTCDIPFVRSFKILEKNQHYFSLTINQNKFIGKYPTRAAALGALMGCVKAGGGGEEAAIISIENMIAKGRGIFEIVALSRTYSVGLNRVADTLVAGGNVMVIGDSFSYGFMPIGRHRSWRPKNWVGALVAGTNENYRSSTGPVSVPLAGSAYAGNESTVLNSTNLTKWPSGNKIFQVDDTIAENNHFYTGWFQRASMGYGGDFDANMYLNSEGNQNYFFPNGYKASIVLPQSDNTITSFKLWQAGNEYTRGGSGTKWKSTITLGPDPEAWTSSVTPDQYGPFFKASSSDNFGGIELTNPAHSSSSTNNTNEVGLMSDGGSHNTETIGAQVIGYRSLETTPGLWLGHLGYGGKTTGNFNSNVSDEYISFMLDTMFPTDLVIIQFHHNDFANSTNIDTYKTNLQTAINKIKSATTRELRFLVILGPVTSHADGSDTYVDEYEAAKTSLRTLPIDNDDVAFLDGYSLVKDAYGDFATLHSSGFYDEDDDSGIHPSVDTNTSSLTPTDGSSKTAAKEWEEISAVYEESL